MLDLSHNSFNSSSLVSALFQGHNASLAPLLLQGSTIFDLSYNKFMSLDSTFRELYSDFSYAIQGLFLRSCGLTSIPSYSFNGSHISSLDLSFNNFQTGLFSDSFASKPLVSRLIGITCSFCHLIHVSFPSGIWNSGSELEDNHSLLLNLANDVTLNIYANYSTASQNDKRMLSYNSIVSANTPYSYSIGSDFIAAYLSSGANYFSTFPAGTFHSYSINLPAYQFSWCHIWLGDIAGFAGGNGDFLQDSKFLSSIYGSLGVTLYLAATTIAQHQGHDNTCIMQQLTQVLSYPKFNASFIPSGNLQFIEIMGFDLPPASTLDVCPLSTDCAAVDSCYLIHNRARATWTIPVEPLFLNQYFIQWISNFVRPYNDYYQVDLNVELSLRYQAPLWGMWNPVLNSDAWLTPTLFTNTHFTHIQVPGLPFTNGIDNLQPQFPHSISNSFLQNLLYQRQIRVIDLSLVRLLTHDLLSNIISFTVSPVELIFHPTVLWGYLPIPLSFFDPILNLVNIVIRSSPLQDLDCQALHTNTCQLSQTMCSYVVNYQCEMCPPGFYSASANGILYCATCTPGYFCDSSFPQPGQNDSNTSPYAVVRRIPCSAGYYSTGPRQSSCLPCPSSTFNSMSGSVGISSCSSCPPGRAGNISGGISIDHACSACEPGKFSNQYGLQECMECTHGTYSNDTGSISCINCPANHYSSISGSVSLNDCELCPASAPYSPPGSDVDNCHVPICSPGFWTLPDSLNFCASHCPSGHFCIDGQVHECPPGTFQEGTGASHCNQCGAGRYSNTRANSNISQCIDCPQSTWSHDSIASSCHFCNAGTFSTAIGQTDNSICSPPNEPCTTFDQLTRDSVSDYFLSAYSPSTYFCMFAVTEPLDISKLTDESRAFMAQFLLIVFNQSPLLDPFVNYPTLRQAESLRLASFESDETLETYNALSQATSDSSADMIRIPKHQTVSDQGIIACIVILTSLGAISLVCYSRCPTSLASTIDLFKWNHNVDFGESRKNQPSLLGAALSFTFLCMAILVAVLLASNPTDSVITTLLPPSGSSHAGLATGNFQITLKLFSDAASSQQMCHQSLFESQTKSIGFSDDIQVRTKQEDQSCSIALDCLECGVTSQHSLPPSVTVSFPSSVQLIEWELWISSAAPTSWARRYGVLHQLPDTRYQHEQQQSYNNTRLLDEHGLLKFSLTEAFYQDKRDGSKSDAFRSGYEFDFTSYSTLTPSQSSNFQTDSQLSLTISFAKESIVYQTTVTRLQSPIQLVASIFSTIMSLLAVFGGIFGFLEVYVIGRALKRSVGLLFFNPDTKKWFSQHASNSVGPMQNVTQDKLVDEAQFKDQENKQSHSINVQQQDK